MKLILIAVSLFILYYVVVILLDLVKASQQKRGSANNSLITFENRYEDSEEEPNVIPLKKAFLKNTPTMKISKNETSLQIENIAGIHMISDNELVGIESEEYDQNTSFPVNEFISKLESNK